MEDDEEYSYKSYSADTAEKLTNVATFKDNEEVFSYSGYDYGFNDDDESAATAEERSEGGFIVEEFSAEVNVPRVAKMMRLSENTVTYAFAAVYLILGVLCVTITDYITHYLAYLVGSMMLLIGIVRFIVAIVHREYRSTKTNQTASSMIIAALGAMIIFQQLDPENDPIMLITIVWGVLGLLEAAHAFNHAFYRISNSQSAVYFTFKGILECIVAFMMLYHPESEAAHHFHIIVFGANLIMDSITMIPQVKKFFAMR